MESTRGIWVAMVLGLALTACSTGANQTRGNPIGQRTDVFQEVVEPGEVPPEDADLIIKASVKTHLAGRYLIEPKGTHHGDKTYPFLLNVDGQSIVWEVDGHVEEAPAYNELGKRNPERGEGMRYSLIRRMRLKPGAHRIHFELPGEGRSKDVVVDMAAGRVHVLEFRPVYNRYRLKGEIFDRGVARIEAISGQGS